VAAEPEAVTRAVPHLAPANEPMPAALLERLAAVLEGLERRLAPLEAANEPMRAECRLLSMRQAARRLGISRTRTLPDLIRDRRIRTVTVNGRPKVPAHEVERIEREGTASFSVANKAKRPAPRRRQAPLARDLV